MNPSLYPNPDYWLSYVFKRLVGRQVLAASVQPGGAASADHVRVYAHCTSTRAGYRPGAITLYAINLNDTTPALLHLAAGHDVYLYLMTPQNNQLTSRYVQLNGKILRMPDDSTLPALEAVPVTDAKVTLPALTYAFVVMQPTSDVIMTSVCS